MRRATLGLAGSPLWSIRANWVKPDGVMAMMLDAPILRITPEIVSLIAEIDDFKGARRATMNLKRLIPPP
jgi:hypothetical protein